MLESKIQSNILKKLTDNGIYAHKNITTNKKGIPDIIACVNGKYLALEVKQPGGKATELQLYNIDMIRKSGGVAEIVHSWLEVIKVLEEMK